MSWEQFRANLKMLILLEQVLIEHFAAGAFFRHKDAFFNQRIYMGKHLL